MNPSPENTCKGSVTPVEPAFPVFGRPKRGFSNPWKINRLLFISEPFASIFYR
jgi:hypothetical protein